MIADGHDDERTINERLDALASRRKKLQNDLTDRRTKLEDSRKIAQFYQDVVEVTLCVFLCVTLYVICLSLRFSFRIYIITELNISHLHTNVKKYMGMPHDIWNN